MARNLRGADKSPSPSLWQRMLHFLSRCYLNRVSNTTEKQNTRLEPQAEMLKGICSKPSLRKAAMSLRVLYGKQDRLEDYRRLIEEDWVGGGADLEVTTSGMGVDVLGWHPSFYTRLNRYGNKAEAVMTSDLMEQQFHYDSETVTVFGSRVCHHVVASRQSDRFSTAPPTCLRFHETNVSQRLTCLHSARI